MTMEMHPMIRINTIRATRLQVMYNKSLVFVSLLVVEIVVVGVVVVRASVVGTSVVAVSFVGISVVGIKKLFGANEFPFFQRVIIVCIQP
jgi:hypothetical protein